MYLRAIMEDTGPDPDDDEPARRVSMGDLAGGQASDQH